MKFPTGLRFWRYAVAVYILLTFVLSSLPADRLIPPVGFRIDWILHTIEYCILGWILLRWLALDAVEWPGWRRVGLTLLIASAVGGLNELWQTQVPGRFCSLSDEIANILGAAVAILWYNSRLISKLRKQP
jgi:VanZ family protein